MNYYTSDLEFSYGKIIDLCKRPFASKEEMNTTLINNINKKCMSDDVLHIVGDVAGKAYVVDLLHQIKCHKILIIGNHDEYQLQFNSFRRCFDDIFQTKTVIEKIDGEEFHIFLNHSPSVDWDGFYRGNWQFYGHVHNYTQGGSVIMNLFPTAVNVGVDVQGFEPQTAEYLIKNRLKQYRKPDITMEQFLNTAIYVESDQRYKRSCDFSAYKT